MLCFFFFFNDTATTEIYTLSLHDALPIFGGIYQYQGNDTKALEYLFNSLRNGEESGEQFRIASAFLAIAQRIRSEEHTSELQSHLNLVCRLLLEKKKKDVP